VSSDPDKPSPDGAAPEPAGAAPAASREAAPIASESGSINVAMSSTAIAVAPAASESGSIDVAMSSPYLRPDASGPTDGTPVMVGHGDSGPATSGAVRAVAPHEPTGRRSGKRLTEGMKDALGDGVTRLGTGIGTIGEGVSKLGEKSRKVPLVGSSVSALGEGITTVGESLTELPRVASTRRGRLMLRSLVVGFLLVAAWIAVIVAVQIRGTDAPDFRPHAEKILIELSNGPAAIGQVYEQASPRFQEFVSKEGFVDNMTDLHATAGKFKEITAVNESLVTRGPSGRVGRVSLTVAYEQGKTKASVSLHWHERQWKLLGIGVEVPPEVKISQAQREARVQACKDPMDPKTCEVFVAANAILEKLRDGRTGEVWDQADSVFQKQEEKTRWVAIQREHQAILGEYRRIIAVTEAKMFGGTTVTYDVLLEYARANGVRAIFGFARASRSDPWALRSLKIVLPMPRADEPADEAGSAAGSAVDATGSGR